MDKATLLSSHNNQDDYSDKDGFEIDNFKLTPYTNKRWNVELEEGQNFTLVFAAK